MSFLRRYSIVIGVAILACVIVLLLTDPKLVFSPGVSFISTDLHRSTGNEVYVRTKLDFGAQEHMNSFPKQIGEWVGYDYDTTEVTEFLEADVVLLRAYNSSNFSQPLFFTIVQSQTESSFHPPDICYAGQGFTIQEEAKDYILIADPSWTEEVSTVTIPINKMLIFKESGGQITERRLSIFFYVKGNQFTTDTITMIQTEALVPIDGSYEGILNLAKEFTASTIPFMFEPRENGEWNPLALQLIDNGIGGYFAVAFLILLPSIIIVYPTVRKRKRLVKRYDSTVET